jgi:hypothetical protein
MPTPLQLRSDVAVLTGQATRDLAPVWRGAETALAVEAALRDVLPALVDEYGDSAALLAADWYDDLRDERGVRGRFRASPAVIAETGTQALVGWALAEIADPTNLPAFRSLIEGGTQRRIANFSRLTVMESAVADPQARGWQRTGLGDCSFCAMLIGRGAVYTESSADFQSHDHCQCGSEPAWR